MGKVVAIDLDDVVFPLVEKWLWFWTEYSGQQLHKSDITGWDMGRFIERDFDPKEFYDLLKRPDLYDDMPLIEGAKEGIERIREIVGWENVYFLTAGFHEGKRKLLREHGIIDGWEDEKQVVYMRDKHRFEADILIDDRYETILEWEEAGKDGILFDQPWNRVDGRYEVTSVAQGKSDYIKWTSVVAYIRLLNDYEGNIWSSDEGINLENENSNIVTNEAGGMQSNVEGRYDLIAPLAMRVLAEVYAFGVRVRGYPTDNWRLIPVEDHVNHGLNHIFQYLAAQRNLPHDEGEDHLAHAMWRLVAAVEMRESEK